MSESKVSPSRIFGLDLIRAIAILFVVMGHGGFLLNDSVIDGLPYFKMIDGVDLFFVLSGFLIGSILLKDINQNEKFGFKNLLHFWKRRWFRTLPNYYLILLLNYLFVRFNIASGDIESFNFQFITFTQNFHTPFSGFFWESWSLSVEEWFYLISPFLIWVLLRRITPKHSFLISCLLMILLPLLYRVHLSADNIGFWQWDIGFRKIVLTRLDSIGFGLLTAWTFYYFPTFWKKCRWISLLLGILLIYFVTHFEAEHKTFYKQVWFFSLSPIAAMLLIPMAQHWKTAKGYIARAVVHISKISYSMYLINLGLVALVIKKHFPPTNPNDGILKYFVYWVVVIVVSSLLYRYFEKPMMNLRDHKWFNRKNTSEG